MQRLNNEERLIQIDMDSFLPACLINGVGMQPRIDNCGAEDDNRRKNSL